ncbi:MAG TPA: sensor histidine kinase [Chitinophagaceae bacterium]
MWKPIDRKRLIFYGWIAIAYIVVWVLANSHKYPGNFWSIVLNNVWRVIYVTVINFIFFEYSVPFVLRKRRYSIHSLLLGIILLFSFMMLWSFGMYAWRSLGVALHIYTQLIIYDTIEQALAGQTAFSVGSVFFFGIARHIYNYVKLKQATQQLIIQKKEAELNYLKSQTNPHFLFNTLNNIYSLSRDKSDLAPESILRLSKILRFMLYETSGQYIAIENEIKIINDYIELEKLRYDDSLRIDLKYDIEDQKQALPPLLLMPLVENAFKHGVSEARRTPFVDILLLVNQRQLNFVVKNSSESVSTETIKESIGLSNLRRQLELLYKDFSLSVKQENSVFTATLRINLASHV